MIRTKVESVSKAGITQELEMKGSTAQVLVELKALVTGVLTGMDLKYREEKNEMTLDERIEFFCELMKK